MHAAEPVSEILHGLQAGTVIPYIGPGIWAGALPPPSHPADHLTLVGKLTEKASVPHKIRKNLTAAAQYIENFKHRKTLKQLMTTAYQTAATPTRLHQLFAGMPALPLLVEAWYDDAMQQALASRQDWGQVQGVSHAEHFGEWVRYYTAQGEQCDAEAAATWTTLLYRPLGSVSPAHNFIVSDSDYVEILTEIDIQTPIPPLVQKIRSGRHFLFVGCRFNNQLDRIFAHQIIKRSSDQHWAFIEGELSRNEERFLREHNIMRLDMPASALLDAAEGRETLVQAA